MAGVDPNMPVMGIRSFREQVAGNFSQQRLGAPARIAFGLLPGVRFTFAAGRFLGSQLYGVNPYDPAVVLTAVAALAFSAFAAAPIPAVRASSISPMEALRAE